MPNVAKVGDAALAIVRKYFPKVKKVVDANESLDISVEKADVRDSRKTDPSECAMARACRREYHLDGAIVSVSVAYMVRGGVATRYTVPESVRREIVAFDRFRGFVPGDYRLRKPAPGHRLGYGGGPRNDTGKPTGPKRQPQHITAGIRPRLHA